MPTERINLDEDRTPQENKNREPESSFCGIVGKPRRSCYYRGTWAPVLLSVVCCVPNIGVFQRRRLCGAIIICKFNVRNVSHTTDCLAGATNI